MKYSVTFEWEGVTVKARCKDINAYSEPELLRLSFTDENGDEVFPDYNSMEEIEEIAIDLLFDRRFSPEL